MKGPRGSVQEAGDVVPISDRLLLDEKQVAAALGIKPGSVCNVIARSVGNEVMRSRGKAGQQ